MTVPSSSDAAAAGTGAMEVSLQPPPSKPAEAATGTTTTNGSSAGAKTASAEEEILVHTRSSVSEAAELSAGGWTAPAPLCWIEYLFQVPDPKTGQKLSEATGWAMDSAGRAALNIVGSYVGAAILTLSAREHGERTPSGLKTSSLLTFTTSLTGVFAALMMPVVGAIVDHTRHRKLLGVLSGIVSVAIVGIQIFINEENWLYMLVLDGVQSFALLVHTTAVFAYLPDLTTDQEIIPHYTAHFNLRQFCSQMVYVVMVILVGRARDLPKGLDKTLQSARDNAGMAFGIGLLFVGYPWLFLFRKRPALSKVPEGATLISTGFRQVASTARKIIKDYSALKWFMISLLLSPEAGAGVVLAMAVTFFRTQIKLELQDIAKANLSIMSGNIIGSLFSKQCCRLINPLNTYRVGLFFLSLAIAISVAILDSPDKREAVFGMALTWGFGMGVTYPAQRVLFCTLIPKGQETEMMGLFTFVGQILGWLPTTIFTILNEHDVNMRWGLGVIPFFCTGAILLTLPMGLYVNAVELVARESASKLESVLVATTHQSDEPGNAITATETSQDATNNADEAPPSAPPAAKMETDEEALAQ